MGNDSQVVGFLDRSCAGHGITGGAAAHNVGVVAEDRQRLSGEGAGGNMEDGREHFAGDLVHVGDHQQQTLAGGKSSGQCTGAQAAVDRTGCTGFGLHFSDFDHLAEHVFKTLACPGISVLTHRRGRGDRVDRGCFAECVSNIRCSVVTVDRLLDFSH